MIRLIILALGVFLIWVLFASSFDKPRKILISVVVALFALAGLWWESASDVPRDGRVVREQIELCGIETKHTYRTNFDIHFCLRNNSETATVKRVAAKFIAQRCQPATSCTQIQSINKAIMLTIQPLAEVSYTENLSFDLVEIGDTSVSWTIEIEEVKAVYD